MVPDRGGVGYFVALPDEGGQIVEVFRVRGAAARGDAARVLASAVPLGGLLLVAAALLALPREAGVLE